MRFLFIAPPYERLKGLTIESMPLGLLYIATMLDRAGFYARVYDGDSVFYSGKLDYSNLNRANSQSDYILNLKNTEHPGWQDLRSILIKYKPDFVGISMMTPLYSAIKQTIHIVKEVLPKALILAGGPHITVLQKKAMESLPEIDVAFVGEAEESIVEFAEKMRTNEELSSIKGLMYKKDGEIIFTGMRKRIDDLDSLPFPDRELLINKSKYKKEILGLMISSRGCPFSCTFCASMPLWNRKVRIRSPENIFQEIVYLVNKYNINTFGFWDDTFTINKKNVIEFCKRINKKYGRRKFKWNCLANINQLDERILFWLKRAGCLSVAIGIESGSDRILKLINKGITTKKAGDTARLIKKKGFWLAAFFMVGFPQETEDDIHKTIQFIKEIKPDAINLCTFTPHPGTELYNYVVDKGLFKDYQHYSIYDHIGHHSTNNFFMENISREKYQTLLKKLLTLTTKTTNRLDLRKLWLRSKRITPDKLFIKLKKMLNRFSLKKP